ncbi:MAG TPA: hypothetical protein VHC69_12480 [Polyangiaceae bacterium]|nr:hypothetical protein [Polyangiaceae bacterium]
MRTLGFVACVGSMALVACGSSNDQGPAQPAGLVTAPGAGGAAPGAAGTVATTPPAGTPTAQPGAGGATGVVTPSAGGTSGVVPPPTTGIAGAAPQGVGGTTVTVTGAGGVPAGGAANGGAANGGAGGTAVTPDPPGTISFKTDMFTLDPGEEAYRCQNFDNPFGGKDTAVNRIVTDMTPGSHHLHIYNLTEGTSRSLEVCTAADFHALIHAAGSPHAETDYPDGMATKIKGSTGLRIQLHYINTTSDPIVGYATTKMSPVADVSTIKDWVAELYFNRYSLTVIPGTSTVTTNCVIPNYYGPITLIGGGTHMHSRGTLETAMSSTGAQLAHDTTWDEPPPITYNPPVVLNPGDSITWACTYNNTTGMTLTFGESVQTNEMCIYLARYYTTNSDDTQIECQAQGDQGGTAFLMTD